VTKSASPEALDALRPFVAAVHGAYGARLKAMYLFGSRARGSHRPDSDYDVAVILDDASFARWQEQDRLADIAFESMLSNGIHIQPMPFTVEEWTSREGAIDLVEAARRDAREIEVAA